MNIPDLLLQNLLVLDLFAVVAPLLWIIKSRRDRRMAAAATVQAYAQMQAAITAKCSRSAVDLTMTANEDVHASQVSGIPLIDAVREKDKRARQRTATLTITNREIGDGDFSSEVADVLEAYARAIRAGDAGRLANESLSLPSGTSLRISVLS